jgi:hemerythrin
LSAITLSSVKSDLNTDQYYHKIKGTPVGGGFHCQRLDKIPGTDKIVNAFLRLQAFKATFSEINNLPYKAGFRRKGMPIVEWDDRFLLGNQEIDRHHEHLVELLNRTYDYFTGDATLEQIQGVITELSDYADYHFDCEEQWMSDTSYPQRAEHKIEHEIFVRRIIEIQNGLYKNHKDLAFDLLVLLTNWFTKHILTTDSNYGHFVAANSNANLANNKLVR